jgi:4-hydroxybenzoyl-CoA reductase subunit beta
MDAIAPFTLHRPASLAEAIRVFAATPGAQLIAGGTDLLANRRRGLADADVLVDIGALPELTTMAIDADGDTTLGAGLTLERVAEDETIAAVLPALSAAARQVAGPGHRSAATLGGNLCLDTRCVYYNQSAWWREAKGYCLKHRGDTCHVAPQGRHCHAAFSGDLAPVLLVLGAEVSIAGPRSTRRIPLAELYREDGAHPFTLEPAEIVVAIHVPRQPDGSRCGYRKARVRGAMDFPLAGVAARLVGAPDGRLEELRVALTGTNSRPLLLPGLDALLGHEVDETALAVLRKLVQKQASPMRTTVTAADYRRQVAAVLAQRLVRDLLGLREVAPRAEG